MKAAYIVDFLNEERKYLILQALNVLPFIEVALVDTIGGVVYVESTKKADEHVKYACEVAGAFYRTKMRKRDLEDYIEMIGKRGVIY